MVTRTLPVEVPEEVLALLGGAEAASTAAKEALILELLRDGRLSQGQAARLLEIGRWDLLDLMARHAIPSGPETAEEMQHEIETARRLMAEMDSRDGHQQQ